MRYLRGTTDISLFYSRESKQQLLRYADAGYLSNPHKSRSQIGYVFNYNGTTISWRFVKQTMVVTSSNHSEILAIHETSCKCIWLRSIIQHIRESCGLSSIKVTRQYYLKIMLRALHILKNDTFKVIELSIYCPSLLLSLIPEEWWNCYSTNKIKWQFSRSIHKGIVNCNTQEAHWNTSTQRSPCCATRENIIISTWGVVNW